MATRTVIRLEDLPGIGPAESESLGTDLGVSMTDLLSELSPDEWNAVTRCAPWTVKDVAAHLLGWAEALTSFRELRSQVGRGLRRSKEFGNPTDAQNNIQVEDRRHLSPDQIVEGLRTLVPKEAVTRRRFGTSLRYLPLYSGYLGGVFNAGYLFNTIFLRDMLIHRLDVNAATGREVVTTDADVRVMTDMLKDWTRRTGANVQLADGDDLYVAGAGTSTISAPWYRLIDVLAGRGDAGELEIDGDAESTRDLIRKGVPV